MNRQIDRAFFKAMGLEPLTTYEREILPWLAKLSTPEKKTEKIREIREIHRANDRRAAILSKAIISSN